MIMLEVDSFILQGSWSDPLQAKAELHIKMNPRISGLKNAFSFFSH